jgi:rsbT antagonist protein RsbS
MSFSDVPPVALQLNHGCLVATLQFGSDARVLERFRFDLLERVKTLEAKCIAIDLSSVDLLDAEDFGSIKGTIDMAVLLGARVVLVGIRPGVAASLVELPVNLRDVKTALTLEAATEWLRSSG